MSRSRIYKRLFIPYVLALLLGLGGAWLAATQLFSETLENRLHSQLAHTVELLANGSFPYTPRLLRRMSRLIRADIALLDASGRISVSTLASASTQNSVSTPASASTPGDERQALAPHLKTLVRDTVTGDERPATRRFKSGGHQYLLVWNTVPDSRDSRVKYIAAFSSLSDIQHTNQRIAMWLGAVALTGLLLLAWIGHRVSQSITLPIRELAQMASEIAVGNRDIRARIHRRDEIGDLARALNSMAIKLDDYDREIAEQSRMATLGQMTARIAHEIRNPLTAIKMQLQLLKETASAEHLPLLNSLLDETRRLELIVLSTLQHKKIATPVFSATSLNNLVEEIVQLLRLQFEHQDIELSLSLDAELPAVAVDRDMITQIILNLLLNAREELPDGGRIRISTGTTHGNDERQPDSVYFSVDDSGPGIAESHWRTLFTETTSNKPGGFGLGLRLCHELAELHHGHIRIEHSDLGGACFRVSLPLTEPPP
ncbi:MAG TPA: sensor histidine kinase [Thiotrichales bacterium]|nr:sensor histidine kinase [Thiotrichales bacterium]